MTQNGVYKCYANTDLVASYSLNYKPINQQDQKGVSTSSESKKIKLHRA